MIAPNISSFPIFSITSSFVRVVIIKQNINFKILQKIMDREFLMSLRMYWKKLPTILINEL